MPAVTWDTVGLYRDDKSSYIVPYIVEKCNINKKINKKEHIVEWKIVKMGSRRLCSAKWQIKQKFKSY